MNMIHQIPYYKYKVILTEICTGESKTLIYQAPFSYESAKAMAEEICKDSEYELDSVTDITGVVKIAVIPPCPN